MSKLLIIWMIFILIGFIAATVIFPSIGPDSGFYLKTAFDLHRGYSFFQDMNVAYNPLSLFILSFAFDIFPFVGLPLFYAFIILLYFISCSLFYKILGHFNVETQEKRLFSLLLFVSFFILEGSNILLEPFVLVFQLLAVLFLIGWHKKPAFYLLFGGGLFCFMAFFSKQYGISVVAAIVWFIFIHKISWKKFIFDVGIFGLGILIPAILVITCFNHLHVPPDVMIRRLVGIEYLSGNDQVTGIGYNFLLFLESVGRFLGEVPVILILIPLSLQKLKQPASRYVIFLIILILGACVQLYFAGYRHYYQLIVPYCLLLIALLFQKIQPRKAGRIRQYFSILCILFLVLSSFLLVKTIKKRDRLFGQQKQNTILLNQMVPPGQKVYLQGISPAYYYLCQYDSPDLKTLGYRFPDEMSLEYIYKSIPSGTYMIVDTNFINGEKFKEDFVIVTHVLLAEGKECIILQKK